MNRYNTMHTNFKNFFTESHHFKKELLLEKDLRPVLIKNGLSKELADLCHAISDKYSGFVANVAFLKNDVFTHSSPEQQADDIKNNRQAPFIAMARRIIAELFSVENKPKLPMNPNQMSLTDADSLWQQWVIIKDWYTSPMVQDKPNIRTISWEDAYRRADEWHQELAANAKDDNTLTVKNGQEIVLKLDEGYYWVRLNTKYCGEEANAMGHCGRASTGELFSLRDVKGVPRITADINVEDEKAGQIFSKGNTNPPKKYHRKILELLGHLNIQILKPVSYGEGSFSIDDISKEDMNWFDDKFGYELRYAGVSQKDIDAGDKMIDETNKKLKYCSIYTGGDYDDGYISVDQTLHIDLNTTNFEIVEYDIDVNDFRLPKEVDNAMPFSSNLDDREDDVLRWTNASGYNIQTGIPYGQYNEAPYIRWIEQLCDDMLVFDEKVEKFYGDIIIALVDQEFITPNKKSEILKYIDDHTSSKLSLYKSGVKISVIKSDYRYNRDDTPDSSQLLRAIYKISPTQEDLSLIQHYFKYLNKGRVVDAFFANQTPEQQTYFDFIKTSKLSNKEEPLFQLEYTPEYNKPASVNLISANILTTTHPTLIFKIIQQIVDNDEFYFNFTNFILTILGESGAEQQKNTIKKYINNAQYLSELVYNRDTGDILEKNFKSFFNKTILNESPISDISLIGNWNNDKNQGYDAKSLKLLKNPNYLEKVKTKWNKTPEYFDLYFLKGPKLRQFTEIGEVSPEFVKEELKVHIVPKEDHITVIYCNNIGDEKIPLTPFIIAHRFGHALRKIYRKGINPIYEYAEEDYLAYIQRHIIPVLYPNIQDWNDSQYKSLHNNKLLEGTVNQLATFKSARDNNVRNTSEFMNEFLAQYIITGKITLNKNPQTFKPIIKKHSFGKPQYLHIPKHNTHTLEILEDEIQTLEDNMNYNMEQLLGAAVNKIYVM